MFLSDKTNAFWNKKMLNFKLVIILEQFNVFLTQQIL